MSNERYLRHSLIDWFSQDEVAALRVAIVGVGAVGNELAKNLVLLGVGSIDLYDFDTIEVHNLTRSVLFRETDVGEPKVTVATKRLQAMDPNINLNAYHGDFWETLTLKRLSLYDCVFSCVDNFEARIRINRLCGLMGVDFINTGIDSRYVTAEFFPFGQAPQAPCYECSLPDSAYTRIAERYSCGWLKRAAFEAKKIPSTVITASIAAGLATSMLLRYRQEHNSDAALKVFCDTAGFSVRRVSMQRKPSCVACLDFDTNWQLVNAGRQLSSALGWRFESTSDIPTLQTSEQVVLSRVCQNESCKEVGVISDVWSSVDHCDDRLSVCDHCHESSMQISIRDQFSVVELAERFAGKTLPCKFVLFRTETQAICIELGVCDE